MQEFACETDMRRCYILDIDGTIADCGHRVHHVEGPKKDWDAFFDACADDMPIAHMHALVSDLRGNGAVFVYVSGRPERCRTATRVWLLKHDFPMGDMYMRADGDHRNDVVVKLELLNALRADGYRPIIAFDDRMSIVKMWRANGVPGAHIEFARLP